MGSGMYSVHRAAWIDFARRPNGLYRSEALRRLNSSYLIRHTPITSARSTKVQEFDESRQMIIVRVGQDEHVAGRPTIVSLASGPKI